MIRIELNNDSLCEAVEAHIQNMGFNLTGKGVSVRIIAGRSKGSSAEVEITEGTNKPNVPTPRTEQEVEGDAHLQETLPLEEESTTSEDQEPVKVIKRASFGKSSE